jgi:hypothetical protein
MHSSRVGIFDTAGTAGDIAGSASHGARSTDRIAANTVSTAATANSANTADTENPNRNRSRDHMAGREGRGRLSQAKPEA